MTTQKHSLSRMITVLCGLAMAFSIDASAVELDDITIGALLEAEVSVGSDMGENVSDVVLATFELGIEAEPADGIAASATLLWEEDDTELEPKAWNVELACAATEHFEVAAKYEGSDDFPEMPEAQYGIAGAYALADGVTVAMEYLHGTYTGDVDDKDLVTGQVAVEF